MVKLAGYDPRTFGAVLDAVEPGPGLDWRHYRQAGTTAADGQHDHGDATAFGWFGVFDL